MSITEDIRKCLNREAKEDKRNRQITKMLAGKRCPNKDQYVKGYVKSRKEETHVRNDIMGNGRDV